MNVKRAEEYIFKTVHRISRFQIVEEEFRKAAFPAQTPAVKIHPGHDRVRITVQNVLFPLQFGFGVAADRVCPVILAVARRSAILTVKDGIRGNVDEFHPPFPGFRGQTSGINAVDRGSLLRIFLTLVDVGHRRAVQNDIGRKLRQ